MVKNIFEIVNEKELNFVLSSKARECVQQNYQLSEVGIFIHLFYLEDMEFFLDYIKNIPAGIDIYVSVVSEVAKQKIEEYIQKWKIQHCHIIMRENRGRDVSALLVTFRKIMFQYKYVCFVHDKRAKYENVEDRETKMWIRCMWDNTLLSETYIYNVLNLLEKNQSLGLLVPPEIAGTDLTFAYSLALWQYNFSNTLELARKLNLDCNISHEYPPITLGTVFWCKTAALEALLKAEWKYEDFQEEPMPNDGTISHAIERILGYVAQDAGYETGYVISDQFAQSYILQLKDSLRLNENILQYVTSNDTSAHERWGHWLVKKTIMRYMKKYEKVYFYGAGMMGGMCYQMVATENRMPSGFIVSEKANNQGEFLGLPIYTLDEIELNQNIGIVITVGKDYKQEIVKKLESCGITNYLEVS